jgi:hypothetical protein
MTFYYNVLAESRQRQGVFLLFEQTVWTAVAVLLTLASDSKTV